MASSRTAWIAAGLVARLLMLAVLAMAVQSRFANKVHYDFKGAGYDNDLQSYTYSPQTQFKCTFGVQICIPN
jgi:hypothetical protein